MILPFLCLDRCLSLRLSLRFAFCRLKAEADAVEKARLDMLQRLSRQHEADSRQHQVLCKASLKPEDYFLQNLAVHHTTLHDHMQSDAVHQSSAIADKMW